MRLLTLVMLLRNCETFTASVSLTPGATFWIVLLPASIPSWLMVTGPALSSFVVTLLTVTSGFRLTFNASPSFLTKIF